MNLQIALEHRDRVEEFRRKHRIGLLTLLFTDMVGSTQLKQTLGDAGGFARIQQHHALVREVLAGFAEGEEIGTAGDSFFIVFAKPSEAVKFSLLLQSRLRALPCIDSAPVLDRIGIHIGEVIIEERPGSAKSKDLYGIQVDICARLMSLADGDQILMTRSTFDNARQVLKGQDLAPLDPLTWRNYGSYLMQGLDEPIEVCEVGEEGRARLTPPEDSAKAHHAAPSNPIQPGAQTTSAIRWWPYAVAVLAVFGGVALFLQQRRPATPPATAGTTLVRIGFEPGEGYVAGQPLSGKTGWTRGAWTGQLPTGGEGVTTGLIAGSAQHAFIGGVPGEKTPGMHAAVNRNIGFSPTVGGDVMLEMSWRQLITDSNSGARNFFEWVFYNRRGNLLGGIVFDNASRKIFRRKPDNTLIPTGLNFDRGRVYDVKLRFDFPGRTWTADIGGTALGPQALADGEQAMNFGAFAVTWRSVATQVLTPGGPVAGDNVMAFDDLTFAALKPEAKPATSAQR